MTITNQVRGEVQIEGPDGVKHNLCLTLGAMAELEQELGIEDITQIGDRFKKPKVSDLTTIILCLLHGGGHKDITREDLENWPFNIRSFTSKMAEAFVAAGLKDDDDEEGEPAKEPKPGN